MAKRKPKPKKYVEALLHGIRFRVSLTSGSGGRFDTARVRIATIRLGWDQSWPHLVGTLLHESLEAVAGILALRWERWDTEVVDFASLRFFLSHEEFGMICSYAGPFIAAVLPDLEEMWQAAQGKDKGKKEI